MKRIYVLFALLFVLSCGKAQEPLHRTQQSSIDMTQVVGSVILNGNQSYTIYLPPSYAENKTKKYPVLYLLHGMNQDHTHWAKRGNLQEIADKAIENGAFEVIIVCPNGYNSFYYNSPQMRYEDFFVTEFIPAIENRYRILADNENRHIAGLSMGGFGATYLAFKYNHLFGSAYSLSGGFLNPALAAIQAILDGKTSSEIATMPRYTMECGTEDYLVIGSNDALHNLLEKKAFKHQYIRRSGEHNWDFWKEGLPKILNHISD